MFGPARFTVLLLGLFLSISGTMAIAQEDTSSSPNLSPVLLDPAIDTDELALRLVPLTKAEVEVLAAHWLSIVKAKTEEVVDAQIQISRYEGAIEDAARQRVTDVVLQRNLLFDKYIAIVSNWEAKGGDPATTSEYRAYRNSIIVEETRRTDIQTLFALVRSWLVSSDGGLKLAKNIGVIALSLAVLILVAKLVRFFASRWIGHVPNLSKLLQAFLVAAVYWLVMAVGLMVVLEALGIDVSPVFALIGGASFIMAFAFQDTLGNLASGLMIMVNRPFDEGDFVDVGGVAGTVKSVSIVATTVITPDNQTIVIPNKQVWGNVITNVTSSETRRVDLVFGISYDDSIDDALKVLDDTTRRHPLVLKDPEPVIRVHALADSSVNFICRPWAKTGDYWSVYWDLTRQIKERFDEAGISIPYPQQDVYLKDTRAAIASASKR